MCLQLNYVSVLSLIQRHGGDSGLLVSLLVMLRMLPSFVLAPIAGAVADR